MLKELKDDERTKCSEFKCTSAEIEELITRQIPGDCKVEDL
jgi:hypothetical protein